MAEFKIAFENTLKFEDAGLSGVVTVDGGGRTRFGIAEKFHAGLPDDFFTGPAEAALREAEVIEESDYWSAMRLGEIASQLVANKLFDMAVNMGVRQAAVIGQRAANCTLESRGNAVIPPQSAEKRRGPGTPVIARNRTESEESPTPPSSPTREIGSSEAQGWVGAPVVEDGVFGRGTLGAINAIDPDRYLQVLRELCAEFYRHVASLHPEDAVDLKGWLRRAES